MSITPEEVHNDATEKSAETESLTDATALEKRIQELEEQYAQLHDASLRARAEAENTRKRAQQDIANAHKFALETFASNLLAVKDSLEASLSVEATLEAIKSGVELTLKQLNNAFEKHNVMEVTPLGEKFDPNLHQAISSLASETPAQTVINVLQKGYLLNERVIRPALVVVSSGSQAASESKE